MIVCYSVSVCCYSEEIMNLETRSPDLPLVVQFEDENQSPMVVEVREEVREI